LFVADPPPARRKTSDFAEMGGARG